eukprot:scaffold26691_cov141-Skeletonema_menzelii.AAC.1
MRQLIDFPLVPRLGSPGGQPPTRSTSNYARRQIKYNLTIEQIIITKKAMEMPTTIPTAMNLPVHMQQNGPRPEWWCKSADGSS